MFVCVYILVYSILVDQVNRSSPLKLLSAAPYFHDWMSPFACVWAGWEIHYNNFIYWLTEYLYIVTHVHIYTRNCKTDIRVAVIHQSHWYWRPNKYLNKMQKEKKIRWKFRHNQMKEMKNLKWSPPNTFSLELFQFFLFKIVIAVIPVRKIKMRFVHPVYVLCIRTCTIELHWWILYTQTPA